VAEVRVDDSVVVGDAAVNVDVVDAAELAVVETVADA
jgi:hypothetical protein